MALRVSEDARSDRRAFIRNFAVAVALLVPAAFLGDLLAVAVHELLGHGMAALLLGGDFWGFEIHLDGMGWAHVSLGLGAPYWKDVIMLSAGGCPNGS